MRVFGPAENLRQDKGDDSNMTTMLGLMLLLFCLLGLVIVPDQRCEQA